MKFCKYVLRFVIIASMMAATFALYKGDAALASAFMTGAIMGKMQVREIEDEEPS